MAFINEQQKIIRKKINERKGRCAGLAAIQMARIIFNTRATAHFAQQFQIITRALFQALRFDNFILFV